MRARGLANSLALTMLAATAVPGAQDGQAAMSGEAGVITGGRLQGSVRTRDGKPFVGAEVSLFITQTAADRYLPVRYGPLRVRDDGTFEMVRLPPGQAWIVVTKRGESSRGRPGVGPSRKFAEKVTIVEGETTTVALVNRAVLLQGRVTRSGLPGVGLKVSSQLFWNAFPREVWDDLVSPGAFEWPLAGPDGSYSLTVPQPGKTDLSVRSANGAISFQLPAIDVPDVDTHTLDLSVGGTDVAGVVTNAATGEPLANATVSVQGKTHTRADGTGRFVLELPKGDHTITASSNDAAYAESPSLTVSVGEAAPPEVRLRLQRRPSIKGRALDESGHPVEGARIFACTRPAAHRPAVGWLALSAADGSFDVLQLESGAYTVVAHGPGGRIGRRTNVTTDSSALTLTLGAPSVVNLRVTDASGRPASGALAYVQTIDGGLPCGIGSAAADDQGIAAMRLSPAGGKVDVIVRRDPVERRMHVSAAPGRTRELKVRLPRPPPPAP